MLDTVAQLYVIVSRALAAGLVLTGGWMWLHPAMVLT